ncbi:MAG: type II toxin-antitoxin system RelE/ParE family toxin [Bacteroidota bacterium]
MVKRKLKVVIDNKAKKELREVYKYIKKDSLQNAEKVKIAVLSSIKDLIKNPEVHPPDKYRLDKDAYYRAYELYKLRITYHIGTEIISVLRIRHTKMNPLEH